MTELSSAISPTFHRAHSALGALRVVPKKPKSRAVHTLDSELASSATARDGTSSWSAFLVYVNAKGERSERRFTCQSISGFAGAHLIHGYCHERNALRSFRTDRILELVCLETGEIFEPTQHFEFLRMTGALNVEDKALTELARVLVFLARCDGEYHPLERQSLEDHFQRYAFRFGGTDQMIEKAIISHQRLAPDSHDLLQALTKFERSPAGSKLCRFVLDCGASMIDADGRHDEEEVRWAVEISASLKAICDRS